MATDAQVEANRRNARKSTGPKTAKGKEKSRGNAVKHGGRAKTIDVMPVLPQEDPRLLEERIQEWLDDWQPRTAQERELVCHGANLSWKLERAERIEAAHLSERVRKAVGKTGPTASVSKRRTKKVCDLARKLFYDYNSSMYTPGLPMWDNDPAVYVAGLEATEEGCRWLLERWRDLLARGEMNAPWTPSDTYQFVRLLGKHGIEAVNDRHLNAIFVAWEVLKEGQGKARWELFKKQTTDRDPAMADKMVWREFVPRPASEAEANAFIRGVMTEQITRLEQRVAIFEHIAEAGSTELADRAAFDPSPAFDRHRRHQASLGRELLRTVDTLRRLMKLDLPSTVVATDADDHECENATNEAKIESAQDPDSEEVTSQLTKCEDDERSQSEDVGSGDPGEKLEGNGKKALTLPRALDRGRKSTPVLERPSTARPLTVELMRQVLEAAGMLD
jgi:hypothetical protein